MAFERQMLTLAFKAGEDLSSYQYRFVTQLGSDNETVVLMNAATDPPVGILQNAPASGEVAEVMVMGASKLVANAAIAVGKRIKPEYVSTSDNGKADEADTDGDQACALTVLASGAEDDLCTVLFPYPGRNSVPA